MYERMDSQEPKPVNAKLQKEILEVLQRVVEHEAKQGKILLS